MKRLVIMLTSVAIAVVGLSTGADAVVGCGSSVSTSVVLKSDINSCALNPAILINGDDLTLNLNGHTIDGVGTGSGIQMNGQDHVTIENGTVTEFSIGVDLNVGNGPIVKNIVAQGNVPTAMRISDMSNGIYKGNTISGSTNGIVMAGSTGGDVVKSNHITGGNFGIDVNNLSENVLVTKNVITQASTAIRLTAAAVQGSRAEKNVLTHNTTGIDVVGAVNNEVFNNTVNNNVGNGITVESGATSTLLFGNHTSGNGIDGIKVIASDPGEKLGKNVANNNANYGIEAQPGNGDAGGNKAKGNIQFLQCLNVICA